MQLTANLGVAKRVADEAQRLIDLWITIIYAN